jgi:hypothetical protein
MRVAELTRQLEQLKQGQLDRHVLTDSTMTNGQLLDQKPEVGSFSHAVLSKHEDFISIHQQVLYEK